VLRHADTSVCSPELHGISHHPPPTLRQLSAPPHTVSIGFSGAYPSTCCAPNRRSNPIVHRVRRKRQRLPPSLLIENPSERLPLPTRSVMPRRFRSRLATNREWSTNSHSRPARKPHTDSVARNWKPLADPDRSSPATAIVDPNSVSSGFRRRCGALSTEPESHYPRHILGTFLPDAVLDIVPGR
jgi:hypothetical protein